MTTPQMARLFQAGPGKTSIGALSTDNGRIGNINHTTLVVTALWPQSDAYGRKPIVLNRGLCSVIYRRKLVREDYRTVALGAAAPRVIAVAIVRDEYKGRAMAQRGV